VAWLGELLGIAHEDEVARGAGDRLDVGQGHLAGLVDEQCLDTACELLA
jgi:hypothetical protein